MPGAVASLPDARTSLVNVAVRDAVTRRALVRAKWRARQRFRRDAELGIGGRPGERLKRVDLTTRTDMTISELRQRVHALAKWVRRNYGEFEYLGATEFGPRGGRLHVHLLAYVAYVPQGLLSHASARCGLGPVCWVKAAVDPLGAVRYVGKDVVGYVAKDLDGRGRVLRSRDWVPLNERVRAELALARCHTPGWHEHEPRPHPRRLRAS